MREIRSDRLLLVEGRDEEEFFSALLRHMGIDDVDLMHYEGKRRLPDVFPTLLVTPGFSTVVRYAITRDANDDPAAAFQSVQETLRRCQQPCPERPSEFTGGAAREVGVFLLPGTNQLGMLEDLCLRTVADHPVSPCVQDFMQCLAARLARRDAGTPADPHTAYYPKNEAKARAHAFLAGMHELVQRVGVAAHRGYWNLDHPAMDEMKAFLKALGA